MPTWKVAFQCCCDVNGLGAAGGGRCDDDGDGGCASTARDQLLDILPTCEFTIFGESSAPHAVEEGVSYIAVAVDAQPPSPSHLPPPAAPNPLTSQHRNATFHVGTGTRDGLLPLTSRSADCASFLRTTVTPPAT